MLIVQESAAFVKQINLPKPYKSMRYARQWYKTGLFCAHKRNSERLAVDFLCDLVYTAYKVL